MAAAEEEEELQKAWWSLATSLKSFEEETKDLRKECHVLQSKVGANMAAKEKIDQELRDMEVEAFNTRAMYENAVPVFFNFFKFFDRLWGIKSF